MADKLIINVPSVEELEEGYTSFMQMDDSNYIVSAINDVPDAIYDPLSKMYIANPITLQDTRDNADVLADWSCFDTTSGSAITNLIVMDLTETGKGIQVSTEKLTTGWTLESVGYDRWVHGRGYYIDFMVTEPSDKDYAQLPTTFFFGSKTNQVDPNVPGSDDIFKFKLEIFGNENGAATAKIYEYNYDYLGSEFYGGVGPIEWILFGSFQLVSKDFFNRTHRIWIQPITQRRFIIKNVTNGSGIVVKTLISSDVEVALPESAGGGTGEEDFCWADSKFRVEGYNVGFVILRDLEYSYSFTLLSKKSVPINYTSTQDFEIDTRWYAPDSLGSDSAWTETFNIYNEDHDNWQGNGGVEYHWNWTIEGPQDGTLALTTTLGATVSSLKLKLPKVIDSNGLTPTDLFASSDFCVTKVDETRSLDDWQGTLNIEVYGSRSAYDSIGWPQSNGRVQWQIDTGSGYYVRFDGFIDHISGGKFVDFGNNTYQIAYNVSIKTRWRDAEYAVFTGSYALDNMDREDVYTLLAEQMGLDTSTELSIATDLYASQPLPQSELGKKPTLKTKIGQDVLSIFKEIQKFYSVDDKMLFRDNGSGSVVLYITNQDNTNKGTIVRSDPTQSTPLVVAGTGGDNKLLKIEVDDRSFFNDIYVIGGDIEKPDTVYMSNYRRPPSWQDTSSPYYIRTRRILIAINPAWNSQALCNLVGYSLYTKFSKFDVGLSISTFLQYNVYPGDVLTLDAGGETGASDLTIRIKTMRTNMLKLSNPLTRRYSCQLEVEII